MAATGEHLRSTHVSRDQIRDLMLASYRDPHCREWTVQGFGMLRTYLDDDQTTRLQVWDQRLATWANNAIHDHPWNFTSTIIAGTLWNERYQIMEPQDNYPPAWTPWGVYNMVTIQPGAEGKQLTEPEQVVLGRYPLEMYSMGETYYQEASELHMTRYAQGTVTVITRRRVREDTARSLWLHGGEYNLTQVRRANEVEIWHTIATALSNWWPRNTIDSL